MATHEQKQELTEKISRLVANRFGGDYQQAFQYYDRKRRDGKIDKAELEELLKDAEIGNWLTRGAWASGIIEALDADKDGTISASEFQAVLNG